MRRELEIHRTSRPWRLTYNKSVGVYVFVDCVGSQSYIDQDVQDQEDNLPQVVSYVLPSELLRPALGFLFTSARWFQPLRGAAAMENSHVNEPRIVQHSYRHYTANRFRICDNFILQVLYAFRLFEMVVFLNCPFLLICDESE